MYFKWLNCSCVQVNELVVPYAASVHGMYNNDNVNNATSISDLFIKAIMYNEERHHRPDGAALVARLRAKPDTMSVYRGNVTGILTTYYTTSRSYTADILHAIFSTTRGAGTEFPAGKIDECHRLLGLQQQEALLDTEHPLCREYPSAPGGGIVRIFPSRGVGAKQVLSKQNDPASETAKFLLALGEFTPFVLRKTSCRVRSLMFRCWQAASRTGGWKATRWIICGLVRTSPTAAIPPRSTSCSPHCTISCSAS